MKEKIFNIKTAIVFMAVAILSLGVYIYMILRPISYDMEYQTSYEYQGVLFEGSIKFNVDGTMTTTNSNFDEEISSRYYYKDGYVFFLIATTDSQYEKEVEWIDSNFEEALEMSFYASEINAFGLSNEGPDGSKITYDCKDAYTFTVVAGAIEVLLFGFACASFFIFKKTKKEE